MRIVRLAALSGAVVAQAVQEAAVTGPPSGTQKPITYDVPKGAVNCGGHFAESCRVCEAGYGASWCNGDCMWSFGSCELGSPIAGSKQLVEHNLWTWYAWPGSWTLSALLTLLYACLYKRKVVDKYPMEIADHREDYSEDEVEERETGLCVCGHKYRHTLCWAFCCPSVLAAKNYAAAGVCGFWPSCLAFFILLYSPMPCLAAVLRAVLSTKLNYNLRHKSHCCREFFIGLCCFPCAIARDSIEVDQEEGVQVRCLFEVEIEERGLVEEIKEVLHDRSCCVSGKAIKTRMCGPGQHETHESKGVLDFMKPEHKEDHHSSSPRDFALFGHEEKEEKTMWNKFTDAMPFGTKEGH